jgi:maltose alpha-D-glucosyltransferase/alpha-amylase
MKAGTANLAPTPLSADQSNSCVVFGRELFLKLFRKLVPGVNPELEIGRFLAASGSFSHTPALCGSLEYKSTQSESEPLTLGLLQRFTPGKSAWQTTLDQLAVYFGRIAQLLPEDRPSANNTFEPTHEQAAASEKGLENVSPWKMAGRRPIVAAEPLVGDELRKMALLGRRTAELHLALASDTEQARFVPEPFTEIQQQSLRDLASRTCELLRQRLPQVPADVQPAARQVLSQEARLLARFDEIVVEPIDGKRIRCHGDYHLGQVLDLGDDFMIIDFEGEPARSLEERRAKRSPLFDVAGMIRSLHYASSQGLFQQLRSNEQPAMEPNALREAAACWYRWSLSAFLGAYRSTAATGSFLPRSATICDRVLGLFVLEKAVYELAYELNNRPDWVEVPLSGLLELLGPSR